MLFFNCTSDKAISWYSCLILSTVLAQRNSDTGRARYLIYDEPFHHRLLLVREIVYVSQGVKCLSTPSPTRQLAMGCNI